MATNRFVKWLLILAICAIFVVMAFVYLYTLLRTDCCMMDMVNLTSTAMTTHNHAIETLIEGTSEKETATFLAAPLQ